MKQHYSFIRNLFFYWVVLLICNGCNKHNNDEVFCAIPAVVPYQPYSSPVWHPNGLLLGFNHQPLSGVFKNGIEPCTWYTNGIKSDSVGFYIMNKDGTGFKRVTNYMLSAPAWSPDGNWLAFSLGSNLYKMPFNGSTFDTAQITQLTNTGGNFYPSWTANSDTIYFDSNNNAPTGTSFYSIWKMASNGNGKIRITQSTGIGDSREPFVTNDDIVYYIGYVLSQPEIFSMNKRGTDIKQITLNGKNGIRRSPKFYMGTLFFWDARLYATATNMFTPQELVISNETYDISKSGIVVYVSNEGSINDRKYGTLWTMNANGSNKKQLTYNNY